MLQSEGSKETQADLLLTAQDPSKDENQIDIPLSGSAVSLGYHKAHEPGKLRKLNERRRPELKCPSYEQEMKHVLTPARRSLVLDPLQIPCYICRLTRVAGSRTRKRENVVFEPQRYEMQKPNARTWQCVTPTKASVRGFDIVKCWWSGTSSKYWLRHRQW